MMEHDVILESEAGGEDDAPVDHGAKPRQPLGRRVTGKCGGKLGRPPRQR